MLDLNRFSEEQITQLINDRINILEEAAHKTKEIGNVERFDENATHHKGFISRDTKVCYSMSQGYYIKTTDYIREFIEYIKQNNLPPSPKTIFKFLNYYFGERPATDTRNEKDFMEISDFKQSDRAMCTERAALANNILAFLGMKTWFCDGAVYHSNNIAEDHAFLIVKSETGKYRLYDPSYSIYYDNEDHPFTREISEDNATRILNSMPQNPSKRNCVKVQEYYAKNIDGKSQIENANSFRIYGVGIQRDDLIDIVNRRDGREVS